MCAREGFGRNKCLVWQLFDKQHQYDGRGNDSAKTVVATDKSLPVVADSTSNNGHIPDNKRLTKGNKAPQFAYETPILKILYETGGKGSAKDVLAEIQDRMKHQLGDVDYQLLESNSVPR